MARKKLKQGAPAGPVGNPMRGCQFCGGTGWVKDLTSPARERDGKRVEYSAPVIRCRCTNMAIRTAEPPAPPPAGIDQAQRAAGEKEEA